MQSSTLEDSLNKEQGRDEPISSSIKQDYLLSNLLYLNSLFAENGIARAFDIVARALDGSDEDLAKRFLPSFEEGSQDSKERRENKKYALEKARSYKQELSEALQGRRNLSEILPSLAVELQTGSFTLDPKVNDTLKRKLRIDDYINHLANLQTVLNARIDETYEKHALMTYYGMFDQIRGPSWKDMNVRQELYSLAEKKLREDFNKNRLPDLEEAISKYFEEMKTGQEQKQNVSVPDETGIKLKHAYREALKKHGATEKVPDDLSEQFYETYRSIAIDQEFSDFRKEVVDKGKKQMQDSEYIVSLANKLLRGGSEETSTLGIRNWLARHYGQEERAIIKFGIDPTSPDIHLGHAVSLKKLRALQDEGYYVTLLIGGFTATIGEEKEGSERKALTPDQVKQNAKDYYDIATKILDKDKLNVVDNSFWWERLGAPDLTYLFRSIGYKKLIKENRKFQNILQEGRDISLQRLIYPFLQGMDSVFLGAHMEVGGTDQRHNIIVGRELQKYFGLEPQLGLLNQLLPGIRGIEKMSKSLANDIPLSDSPEQMYRKLMKVDDVILADYLRLLTDVDEEYIDKMNYVVGLPLMISRLQKLAEFKEKTTGKPYEFVLDRNDLIHLIEREGENLPFGNGSETALFTAEDYKNAKPMVYSLKDLDAILSSAKPDINYSIMLAKENGGYSVLIEGADDESQKTIDLLMERSTMPGKQAIDPDTGEPLKAGSRYDPVSAHHLLAESVVSQIYGSEAAARAKERYMNKEIPEVDLEQIPKIEYDPNKDLVSLIAEGASVSKSQVQRLLKQGAVRINGQKIKPEQADHVNEFLRDGEENYIRIGKGRYIRFDYNANSF
ncbi:tyrosine--tRNA ligase [Candidatus Woesearchaeota archaeon]|nr:MAG: tyrosine--tRNA ligase [Candidatus Woesearchaeota archaeon]